MTAKQKSILEEWGTWIFRAILVGSCGLVYNEAKQIRRDVKTLMEERREIQSRVSRTEKDIDILTGASNNLYKVILEHQTNHVK